MFHNSSIHPRTEQQNKFTKDPHDKNIFKINIYRRRRRRRRKWNISHLGLGEVKGGREFGPLRDAQVLPFRELLLEREQLLRGERRPRLPVRLVFPQVALDLGRLPVLCNRKAKRFRFEYRHTIVIPSLLTSRGRRGGGYCFAKQPWPTATSVVLFAGRGTVSGNFLRISIRSFSSPPSV